MLPGDAQVLDMIPDNPGDWLFHCHVRLGLDSPQPGTAGVSELDSFGAMSACLMLFLGLSDPWCLAYTRAHARTGCGQHSMLVLGQTHSFEPQHARVLPCAKHRTEAVFALRRSTTTSWPV